MYHPYMHKTAKQEVSRRRQQAEADNLVAEARGERPGLMSRIGAKVGALLRSRNERARRQAEQSVPLDAMESAHRT